MWEAETVPHLVREHTRRLAPWRQPRHAIDAFLAVERQLSSSAPRTAVQILIEDEIHTDKRRKVYSGVRGLRAVLAEKIEVRNRLTVLDREVRAARLRQVVPSNHGRPGQVDHVVRDLAPIVVQPRRRTSHQVLIVGDGLRRQPGRVSEPAENRDPGLWTGDRLLIGLNRIRRVAQRDAGYDQG